MNLWRLGRLGGGEKIQNKLRSVCPDRKQVETVIFLDFEGVQCPEQINSKGGVTGEYPPLERGDGKRESGCNQGEGFPPHDLETHPFTVFSKICET